MMHDPCIRGSKHSIQIRFTRCTHFYQELKEKQVFDLYVLYKPDTIFLLKITDALRQPIDTIITFNALELR